MNLVGKIFVVLILVMSLVFMSFAVATYATHKNWYLMVMNENPSGEKPLGLKFQLANEKESNKQLTDERDRIKTTLENEKKILRDKLAKSQGELDELQKKYELDQKTRAQLVDDQRKAVASLQQLQIAEEGLRKENLALRDDVRKSQQQRDDIRKQMVKQVDDLNQSQMEVKTLQNRNATLVADMAKAKEVLRKFGMKEDPAAYADKPPYALNGVILAALDGGTIEISIGSDDGLLKGHRLQVYRSAEGINRYLGEVEVIDVAPDKAVCKVVPGMQKGAIQVHDRVTSQLASK